jgi:quercetin dioxygenase-like cupin family protein
MIHKLNDAGYREMVPGIRMKTICHGVRTHMVRILLDAGSVLPLHSHLHEQTGTLISGRVLFMIDDQEIDTQPGDSWSFPGGQPHGVQVLEDSIIVEVFSPLREDYLPQGEQL